MDELQEIETMSIRAGNGTCLVLYGRKTKNIFRENEAVETPMLSLSNVDLTYIDGKRFVFYIEDATLLEFMREAINKAHFKTHTGNIVAPI